MPLASVPRNLPCSLLFLPPMLFSLSCTCFYLFIWSCQVLVVAGGIFSCGIWTLSCCTWHLVPRAGIEPRPHAWSLSHQDHQEKIPPVRCLLSLSGLLLPEAGFLWPAGVFYLLLPSEGQEFFLANLLFILPSSAMILLQLTKRFSLLLSSQDHALQRNPCGRPWPSLTLWPARPSLRCSQPLSLTFSSLCPLRKPRTGNWQPGPPSQSVEHTWKGSLMGQGCLRPSIHQILKEGHPVFSVFLWGACSWELQYMFDTSLENVCQKGNK